MALEIELEAPIWPWGRGYKPRVLQFNPDFRVSGWGQPWGSLELVWNKAGGRIRGQAGARVSK